MAAKEVTISIVLVVLMFLFTVTGFNIGVFITALTILPLSSYWAYNNPEWGYGGVMISIGAFLIFIGGGAMFPVSADLLLLVWVGSFVYFAYTYNPKSLIAMNE